MYQTEIFLLSSLGIILTMLLCQTLSIRISFADRALVAIEYFPIKILLYNFSKRKKRKRKLIKETKRLLFFLFPVFKSVNFLLNRSKVKIIALSFSESENSEPHRYFVSSEIAALSKTYINSIIYSVSKSAYTLYQTDNSKIEDVSAFDIEFTTRFYNVISAIAVLIFYSINQLLFLFCKWNFSPIPWFMNKWS